MQNWRSLQTPWSSESFGYLSTVEHPLDEFSVVKLLVPNFCKPLDIFAFPSIFLHYSRSFGFGVNVKSGVVFSKHAHAPTTSNQFLDPALRSELVTYSGELIGIVTDRRGLFCLECVVPWWSLLSTDANWEHSQTPKD